MIDKIHKTDKLNYVKSDDVMFFISHLIILFSTRRRHFLFTEQLLAKKINNNFFSLIAQLLIDIRASLITAPRLLNKI
jgi:hypothetical protein